MPSREEFTRIVRDCNEARVNSVIELNRVVSQALSRLGTVAKQIIVEVLIEEFAQLQAGTPKDTGRAQAGWLMSGEGNAVGFTPGERQATYSPSVPNPASLLNAEVIYVVNNVEYILYHEAGWSKRQPGGFIANFIANIKRRIAEECLFMSGAR